MSDNFSFSSDSCFFDTPVSTLSQHLLFFAYQESSSTSLHHGWWSAKGPILFFFGVGKQDFWERRLRLTAGYHKIWGFVLFLEWVPRLSYRIIDFSLAVHFCTQHGGFGSLLFICSFRVIGLYHYKWHSWVGFIGSFLRVWPRWQRQQETYTPGSCYISFRLGQNRPYWVVYAMDTPARLALVPGDCYCNCTTNIQTLTTKSCSLASANLSDDQLMQMDFNMLNPTSISQPKLALFILLATFLLFNRQEVIATRSHPAFRSLIRAAGIFRFPYMPFFCDR